MEAPPQNISKRLAVSTFRMDLQFYLIHVKGGTIDIWLLITSMQSFSICWPISCNPNLQ